MITCRAQLEQGTEQYLGSMQPGPFCPASLLLFPLPCPSPEHPGACWPHCSKSLRSMPEFSSRLHPLCPLGDDPLDSPSITEREGEFLSLTRLGRSCLGDSGQIALLWWPEEQLVQCGLFLMGTGPWLPPLVLVPLIFC